MNAPTTGLPFKDRFILPAGLTYLDGNSLGPLPRTLNDHLSTMVTEQWGKHLIKGWNIDDWMGQPMRVGNKIGKLIGAPENSVTMGDTLSIKVYQALSAALMMRLKRKVILSDSGNFPTDLYMAEGLIKQLDKGHELRVVEPEDVSRSITTDVAAVMLTQVDYRTGRLHDMKAITEAAHAAGAVMIWDLAHSAGAMPVDVTASNCEFAIGCTYKYLNGGPGAPAFIYARPDIVSNIEPALAGWLGHDAPFAFETSYRPAQDIERLRIGTPPVLQLTALEAALDIWSDIDINDVREKSIALSELFITRVESHCPELTLASPRESKHRGSQVSFAFKHGYAAMQALIAHDVIGDFRAPNIMRFGFTPLYIDETDVEHAVEVLANVIHNRLWDNSAYQRTGRVT
ncbi:kynureninase [bacterium]|nr:kynureninase [bacterium]